MRIGFWGPFYYNYNKEHPKIVQVIIKAPILLNKLQPCRRKISTEPATLDIHLKQHTFCQHSVWKVAEVTQPSEDHRLPRIEGFRLLHEPSNHEGTQNPLQTEIWHCSDFGSTQAQQVLT